VRSPDVSTLDATRRILYKLEPDMLVELLGQLRARETGEPALRELLRVRQLQQYLAFCERRLARVGGIQSGGQRSEARAPPTSRRILTRDERWRVYDAVWSKPIAKVARRYGMPAIELLQSCKELEIPMPPRRYWVKKKAGQQLPRRPRLPTFKRPFC
jgi:hypothetical protein